MSAVAIDTSALLGYLTGRGGGEVSAVGAVLRGGTAVLPPAVVVEALSIPGLPPEVADLITTLDRLEPTPGYWERAGALRGHVTARGRRARLAVTLIAQSCIDHDVPLVAADPDFAEFAIYGLRLHA
ncbi:MAG: hypothetical protein R2745_10635 [Vicinamibacterales bacterium]